MGLEVLQSHIDGVISEYYPENTVDYLLKKKRLLELAKKGNKRAQKKMRLEDIKKLKDLLNEQIRENYGTEARFVEEDDDEVEENRNKDIAVPGLILDDMNGPSGPKTPL